ncbi:interleukin-12 receptor subunit beta-2 [Hypanus sabinus]|uniref:interleukin-12 receptor subunit beta-2 n=1 Tax=Hypanus sabinus TaxID=79690 RepID=UPI0028C3DE59|nr:interleukin-12 receptor subunit beta-2 [Hypanus sabinus]
MEFVGICWIASLITILLCKSKGTESCANGEMRVSPASVIRFGSSINISCILKGSSCNECATQQLCIIENNVKQLVAMQISANEVTVHIPKFENNKSSFACKLHCITEYLICGIDVKAGYPPDPPQNLTCIQKGRTGDITCTWEPGRDTVINTKTVLWFRNESHSFVASATSAEPSTGKCTRHRKTHQGSGFACEFGHSFDPFSTYMAWVTASNQLGNRSSAVMNFTLDEIMKPNPPNISRIECSNSTPLVCTVYWEDGQNAKLFEIQYKIANSSKGGKETLGNATSYKVSGLEHYVDYTFLIRSKLHHTRGLWSNWSSSFVTKTPEAAPIGHLDAWYTIDSSDPSNPRATLLWKPLKVIEIRGRVRGYNVTLRESTKNNATIWTRETKNTWYTVGIPSTGCVITVSAYNSRGSSPPSELRLSSLRDLPPARNISTMYTKNNLLLVEWTEPVKTPMAVQGYVVEWTEVNGKLNQNINWIKLPPQNHSARLTENIKPKTCFQISVYAVYKNGTGKPLSTRKYTAQEASPQSGPSVFTKYETAEIFWNDIPKDQTAGCIDSYTIYIKKEDSELPPAIYKGIDPTSRSYTIPDLKPGARYIVWMTAITKTGEGKSGMPHKFYLHYKSTDLHPNSKSIIMVVVAVTFSVAIVVSGFCLWQSVRSRTLSILSKLTSQLYVKKIPDPANCTWAKEYAAIKGNLDLTCPYFQADTTSVYEDPETLQVEETSSVQELCNGMEAVNQDQSSQLSTFHVQPMASQPQQSEDLSQDLSPGNSQVDILDYKCQLPCSYIEKLSSGEINHQLTDSINSARDQSIGYIPSNFIHITDNTTETSQDFVNSFSFMPLPSLSRMELTYEGKLTLDVVRIDCSSIVE